jgi:hypothetical protein
LRILGVFDSIPQINQHVEKYPCDADVFAVAIGEPFVCMKSLNMNEKAHLDNLVQDNKRSQLEHVREFQENLNSEKAGDNIMPKQSESIPIKKDLDSFVQSISKTAEISGQTAAIISVIRDINETNISEQQPGFYIWSVWESVEAAKAHVKDVAAPKDKTKTYDLVFLYNWLCPSKVDLNDLEEDFHDDELTKIIAHRKSESAKVRNYQSICDEKGVLPCMRDIDKKLIFGPDVAIDPMVEFVVPPESTQTIKPILDSDPTADSLDSK